MMGYLSRGLLPTGDFTGQARFADDTIQGNTEEAKCLESRGWIAVR
jgi:hypothetical protein